MLINPPVQDLDDHPEFGNADYGKFIGQKYKDAFSTGTRNRGYDSKFPKGRGSRKRNGGGDLNSSSDTWKIDDSSDSGSQSAIGGRRRRKKKNRKGNNNDSDDDSSYSSSDMTRGKGRNRGKSKHRKHGDDDQDYSDYSDDSDMENGSGHYGRRRRRKKNRKPKLDSEGNVISNSSSESWSDDEFNNGGSRKPRKKKIVDKDGRVRYVTVHRRDKNNSGDENISQFSQNGGSQKRNLDGSYANGTTNATPNHKRKLTKFERRFADHFNEITYNILKKKINPETFFNCLYKSSNFYFFFEFSIIICIYL